MIEDSFVVRPAFRDRSVLQTETATRCTARPVPLGLCAASFPQIFPPWHNFPIDKPARMMYTNDHYHRADTARFRSLKIYSQTLVQNSSAAPVQARVALHNSPNAPVKAQNNLHPKAQSVTAAIPQRSAHFPACQRLATNPADSRFRAIAQNP
jgi:hypothetical protein